MARATQEADITETSPYADRPGITRDNLPSQLGRYRVLGVLGHGGMGVVYEAHDPVLNRKIALKLLHPNRAIGDEDTGSRRFRLLKEAQAMARLSHPNVLSIFDVGELGNDVFLAMELCPGKNLSEWLRKPRSLRAILEAFVAAGRGLAAAHAAGLVHRDFKPSNVLCGDDGRVRVTDFGLAEQRGDVSDSGVVMGTPAYMSPEQRRGEPTDEQSDQYSFCVSLSEAVASQRRVPARLRRLLKRGLSTDPRARFPSMGALLGELEALRRGRRGLVIFGVTAAAGLGLALALSGQYNDVCAAAGDRFGEVFDPGTQEKLVAAFTRSGHPEGAAVAARLGLAFKNFGSNWSAQRKEACEATHVRGEQSDALLDLRMQCSDRQLGEFQSLLNLYTGKIERDMVENAALAAWRLPLASDCSAERAPAALPLLPETPELRTRVAAVRAILLRAGALEKAGQYQEGRDLVKEVLPEARDTHFAPLEAEATLQYGELLDLSGQAEEAEPALRDAALLAAQAGDDMRMARAWIDLVFVLGMGLAKHEEALQVAELAQTVATRARDRALQGMLENHTGAVLFAIGRASEAEAAFRRALAIRTEVHGADHPDVASSLSNLGSALANQGRFDEASEAQERAYQIRRRALGENHPTVAKSLGNLGRIASARNELDRAIDYETRALEVRRRAFVSPHPEIGISLSNLGGHHAAKQDCPGAIPWYEQARVEFEAVFPKDHPYIARVLSGLGECYVTVGRAKQAEPMLERALAIHAALDNPIETANAEYALATALDALDPGAPRAQELMRSARDRYKAGGPTTGNWHKMAVDWLKTHRGR